jgi:hypothetical protein
VESSCELGNEFSGSIKCWELPNGCTTCGLSSVLSSTELVSYVFLHANLLCGNAGKLNLHQIQIKAIIYIYICVCVCV